MSDLDDFIPTPDDNDLKIVNGMVNEIRTLREEIERHTLAAKELAQAERELSQFELPEKMREIGLSNFTMKDGTKVSIQHKVKASLTAVKKEMGFKWLRDNGHGDLIKPRTVQENVHAGTLSAFCAEQLALGRPLPTSLFGVYEFDQTIIK